MDTASAASSSGINIIISIRVSIKLISVLIILIFSRIVTMDFRSGQLGNVERDVVLW